MIYESPHFIEIAIGVKGENLVLSYILLPDAVKAPKTIAGSESTFFFRFLIQLTARIVRMTYRSRLEREIAE